MEAAIARAAAAAALRPVSARWRPASSVHPPKDTRCTAALHDLQQALQYTVKQVQLVVGGGWRQLTARER